MKEKRSFYPYNITVTESHTSGDENKNELVKETDAFVDLILRSITTKKSNQHRVILLSKNNAKEKNVDITKWFYIKMIILLYNNEIPKDQ